MNKKRPNTKQYRTPFIKKVMWGMFILVGLFALIINLGDPRFLAFLAISLFVSSFSRH